MAVFSGLLPKIWRCETSALKSVTRLLNDYQGALHASVSSSALCRGVIKPLQTKPGFLRRVIAGDESWVFVYDSESRCQSTQWNFLKSPTLKMEWQSKSKVKIMFIKFFDVRGIINSDFLPQGQTITQQVHMGILRHMIRLVHENGQKPR